MKCTVQAMKLEVIVRSSGEVLCHEVVEKNESSLNKVEKPKKIRGPIEFDDKKVKNTDEKSKGKSVFSKSSPKKVQEVKKIREPIWKGDQYSKSTEGELKIGPNEKPFFSKPIKIEFEKMGKNTDDKPKGNSVFSKNKSNPKKVQKAKKIREPNGNGEQKNKSTAKESKVGSKESLFSKLMCCCRNKKAKETNQEPLSASENVPTTNVQAERSNSVLSLSFKDAENAVDHLNVEQINVFDSKNEEASGNNTDSLPLESQIHFDEQFESGETLDPLDQINHIDNESAYSIEPVEPLTKQYSSELLLVNDNVAEDNVSNHEDVTPRSHSDIEPDDAINFVEPSVKEFADEFALSPGVTNVDLSQTSPNELSDNESIENDGEYIADLHFEARILFNSN